MANESVSGLYQLVHVKQEDQGVSYVRSDSLSAAAEALLRDRCTLLAWGGNTDARGSFNITSSSSS